ncbi:hypothetical protein SteCoe_19248 [Stentor coeruleus]|uniref:Uncharacterized protein n=1 Tax=Stentor coeruleus TaxID=5963 RepID=A0A1R2BUM2_9CILI|nr:hypothetical protein SteCoe_19248 [Stentor coeruleus]
MLEVYKRFLFAGNQKISFIGIFRAAKYTRIYYKERKELKKIHKLRFFDYPFLYRLQQQQSSLQTKSLYSTTISKFAQEKHSALKSSSFSSNLISFYSDEKEKLKYQGISSYILQKLYSIKNLVSRYLTIESISKWIVTYANLYHKSLEELVQGHREVTKNHETILDDGVKVSDKLKIFEDKLKGYNIDYEKVAEKFKKDKK